MALTDDLDNARQDVARAATPGAPAGVSAPAQRVAPRPSAGTIAGSALRGGLAGAAETGRRTITSAASAVGNAVERGTAPARAGVGNYLSFARDAGRALAGLPQAASAGQPAGLPSAPVPRVAQKPSFSDVQSRVLPAPARPDFSDVASRPVPTAPAPAAAPAGQPSGIQRGVDAAGNSVYSDSAAGLQQGVQLANAGFGTGGARRVAPGSLTDAGLATSPAAAAPAAAAPAAAVQPPAAAARPVANIGAPAAIVAPRPAPTQAVRGRQGAVIRNPNDTLVDRLTRAMGSASLKGSPSGRAAVAQAILGEEAGVRDERMQTLRTQDQADLAAQQANAVSAENAANRQMDASRVNAQLADSAAGRAAGIEMARLARRPEVSVSADGGMGVVGEDGAWRPVTSTDGTQIRAPQAPRQTGQLSDGDRLKSYTDRYNAIVSGLGSSEEKASAVAALDADPLYAGLRSDPAGTPTYEQFSAAAKSGGSKMTDEQLRAAFSERYGQ